jgi:predicted ATP-dependent serine protease
MSRRAIWEQLYQRFDVYQYVTSPRWRAARPRSPARKIIEILATPFASDARILVTGTIGTGKTTELLRVVEARADHEFVVFLDLARHFDRSST